MNRPAVSGGAPLDGMFASMQKAQPSEVAIDLIDVEAQVRTKFESDEQSLAGLAETIKKIGLITPILLRTRPAGRYLLVAGERRLRAAKLAGLTKIKANIRTFSDDESGLAQLIENLQRLDLDPLETAQGLKVQLEKLNGDRTALLTALGRPNGGAWLSQHLALLDLPPQAARLLNDGLSSDVSTINQVKQLEKHSPEKAKEIVDQAAAKPGGGQLRKQVSDAVKQVKPPASGGKKAAAGSGSQPSTATPRDRTQEEPGAPKVISGGSGGGSIFPAAPMKPNERAITTLIEAAKKPGSDTVTVVAAVSTTDRELITKQGSEFFERGKKTVDLVPALITGLARNEFGKTPVELFNLTAFLLGQGQADTFTVDAVVAAIASAK